MNKAYRASLLTLLLIPVVMMAAGSIFSAIDPEIAARHANYERNYRLLEWLRHAILGSGAIVCLGLWLATCFLMLRARQRSMAWIALAVFGPLGFAVLAMLNDRAPDPADIHEAFRARLGRVRRVAYESLLFVGIWMTAFSAIMLKESVTAILEASRRGVPVARILEERDASSGMWAFSEGLQAMYIVVLLYLLWPVAVNLACRLWRRRQRHNR